MAEDSIDRLIIELDELETESEFMRRILGSKNCSDHLKIYNRFWIIQKRIKEIKHLLMLCGHIP